MLTTIDTNKVTDVANTKISQPTVTLKTSDSVQTRVLLALWTLGEATRSELKSSVARKREKETSVESEQRIVLYQEAIAQLEKAEAVAIKNNKIFLADKGLQQLDRALLDPAFSFEAQIGAKTANALLRWIQQRMVAVPAQTNGKAMSQAIASYEEFKAMTLEVFDRLNRDFNFDNLVPIYRIRRELGDRVGRSEFSEWLLKMQADDIMQLQGGSVEDGALDKVEDSVSTEINGLRCYAKRLA